MTHEQKCAVILDRLECVKDLVEGVRNRDILSASNLHLECNQRPYEGDVLMIRMDEIIANVLEPEHENSAG